MPGAFDASGSKRAVKRRKKQYEAAFGRCGDQQAAISNLCSLPCNSRVPPRRSAMQTVFFNSSPCPATLPPQKEKEKVDLHFLVSFPKPWAAMF